MIQWMLTSSVLILLVIAVRGLFKEKMKAKYTYALWLIVLVRLFCPVNFGELSFNLLSLAEEGKNLVEEQREAQESVLPQTEADMLWEQQKAYVELHGIRYVVSENPTEIADYLPDSSNESIRSGEVLPLETDGTVPQAQQQEISGFQLPVINWQKALPIVWAVGMVVLAVVIVSVNISFSTRLGLFRKEVPAFSRKGQGSRKLPVYLVDGITSSCLYGVVRPSIYLNRKEMGEQEERYCIEHEYSHYLQGDMLWSVCRIVCLILHWYNPLVWLAVMLSKKDAELACDERTIERLGEEERYSYGHTLVELAAKQSRAVQMFSMATLMASDKKEVVERVKAIAIKKQTKIITGLLVVCLLVGIGCFIFTGAVKGEQDNDKNVAPVATETPVPTKEATKKEPAATVTKAPEKKAEEKATPTPLPAYVVDVGYRVDTYCSLLDDILEKKEFPVQGLVAANQLNVRSGPGTGYDKLTILGMDTEVTILDVVEENNTHWYKITCETSPVLQGAQTGYVMSCYIAWAGTFRLYENPQEDSAYITLDYTPGVVRGITDAGSDWFYAETADYQSGWIRYGEHGGVDECIRQRLAFVTESGWDWFREKQKQEIVLTLTEEINYTPLAFTDHVALEQVPKEGWLIDLNGDGVQEKLYIDANGVYINGEKKFLISNQQTFWLLDIDTTDGIYELLTGSGNLYIYNGESFRVVKGINEIYYAEEYSSTPVALKRYMGTLNGFMRVDEHTISFENCFFGGVSFFATAEYTLDENHNLQIVQKEYGIHQVEEIDVLISTDDESYYSMEVEAKKFRVYAEPNPDSSYVEVNWLEAVKILKADCVEWLYAEAADGISGWLHYDETEENRFRILVTE